MNKRVSGLRELRFLLHLSDYRIDSSGTTVPFCVGPNANRALFRFP